MTDPVEVFFPEENTGLQLLGGKIQEVEDRLSEYSVLGESGFRKASEEDLPDKLIYQNKTVYMQEYEIPFYEGENHLNPDVDTGAIYSVATTEGHHFIAENKELSRHLPKVNSDFYANRE